ncbi:Sporulation-specific protein 22 [Smittium mucronatum]|uniref:Sporulation-specific protein 22 n=1 Tax=Smittium mucronatum TaxID=133383 RepID=A0A1R0H7I9_9FUNG|nr:Sporulation-specific protein 22 [Smittium mucronatum]
MFQVKMENLTSISESFLVTRNPVMIGLSVPMLQSVSKLSLYNNPKMVSLRLDKLERVNDLQVVQTAIHGLGRNSVTRLNSLEIGSNPNFSLIDFSYLVSINGPLSIVNNDPQASGNFPVLKKVGGAVTIRNLARINLEQVSSIGDTFNMIGNSFKNFSLNAVSSAGKDIAIMDNVNLNELSFSNLTSIDGGLQIKNNSALEQISPDSFPKLTTIKGGLNIYGPLTNISLPATTNILGAISIESSESLECNKIKAQFRSASKGLFNCTEKKISSPPTKKELGDSSSIHSSLPSPNPSSTGVPLRIELYQLSLLYFFFIFLH